MGKFRNDDWVHVDDALPTERGRYQVAILRNGKYYVTMRKFFPDKPRWNSSEWEKGTNGVRYWKPMSDLPNGCEPITGNDIRLRGIMLKF